VKIANIIKTAFDSSSLIFPKSWENPENRTDIKPFCADDKKTKKELEIEKAKSIKTQMKSRIRSLKSLLDKYNDLLSNQNIEKIYDEIVALEKSIGKLNVYAAIEDRIIRATKVFEKFGFNEGSIFLKNAAEISSETFDAGPTDQTTIQNPKLKSEVDEIIGKLEGISKVLKMRELVRELSKIDIMLSELGMASYFPEITDSLSKLVEGYSYSSNRIESIISKLRGSGKPAGLNVEMPKVKAPEVKAP